jgi:hypothetical protein
MLASAHARGQIWGLKPGRAVLGMKSLELSVVAATPRYRAPTFRRRGPGRLAAAHFIVSSILWGSITRSGLAGGVFRAEIIRK